MGDSALSPLSKRAVVLAGTAAAYFIAGKLGLLLAIPPGYATAVFPASGIALAGVLLFGYGLWPGILLGSFLMNVGTSLDGGSAAAILKSVSVPLAIGAGAALQAVAGGWLIRRWIGFPTPLAREKEVLLFLALGGPVGCLASATCGATSLLLAGSIPASAYAVHWWTWWVGDAIGVLVFTPMILLLAARPGPKGRRRQLSVALPLGTTFALVVLLFTYASRWQLALPAGVREQILWTVLAGGLAFTGILGAFLLVVTGRTEAVEALVAEKTRELERSNAELEQFAYAASHDLQEPLRMVASFVQVLEEKYKDSLDPQTRLCIRYAVEGAQRMGRMIRDLLTFAREGSGDEPFEPVDCGQGLAQALANLALAIRESGADVRSGPLPVVRGNKSQIVVLFQNLVGNAIKYRAAAPPRIDVEAERQGDFWIFRVRDNGIGIDPKHHARLFRLFQRVQPRGEHAGTGIGLAVAKKIVERHGGRISVESEEGRGATFLFSLPAGGSGEAGAGSRPE